jgi:hypothetical protein
MKYSLDINVGEILSAHEIIQEFPNTYRFHKYLCPVCEKRTELCAGLIIDPYFRHMDKSEDCKFYFGGYSQSIANKTINNKIKQLYLKDIRYIFESLGFRKNRGIGSQAKISSSVGICDFTYQKFRVWIREIDLFVKNMDSIVINLENEEDIIPIFFIINETRFQQMKNISESALPDRIKVFLSEVHPIIFEIPNEISLSTDRIIIWIQKDEKIYSPGRISMKKLIKTFKFRFDTLQSYFDEQGMLKIDTLEETIDPKYLIKDLFEVDKRCEKCGNSHKIKIQLDNNDNISFYTPPYASSREETFYINKAMNSAICKNCRNKLMSNLDLYNYWSKKQTEFLVENIKGYIKYLECT